MRLRIKTKRGYFPCQPVRTEQTEDNDTCEENPAAMTKPAPRLSCLSKNLRVSPAMAACGQQVELRTNGTISGKTPLHGLTACDLSGCCTTEWDPPHVSSAALSTPHFSIFLQERNLVVTCSFSISPCFRRNNKKN